MLQPHWYVRIQSEWWRWRSIQNGFEDHTTRVASERQRSGTHLVQNCPWLRVGALFVVLVGITWGFYRRLVPKQVLFQQTEITQLTTSGKVGDAAISPDGRYVAYTVGVFYERSKSLWVEQVTTGSDVQLIPPADVGYGGLIFSRDGDFLYFVQSKGGRLGSLYKIPVLGGRQES